MLADARWVAPHGIGRFAGEVLARFPEVERLPATLPVLHPLEPLWLSATLAKRRPDLYFSPGFNPPLWSSVPFVFTIHDLVHLHFPGETSWVKRLYYRRVVRPAVARARRVLTVSEFSKREIVGWARVPQDQVVVVGNGVTSPFEPDGPRHDEGSPYLLYVGLRRPHKNVARLLEAYTMSGLREEVRLLFVGPADPWRTDIGPVDEWTAGLLNRAGLSDAVSFVGELTDEELAAYYRGAMGLVLPSLYEGFGLPALEAMACGTPVLAAQAGALPEVVGDAGLLVDPRSSEALAKGMRSLVADVKLTESLREQGPVRAAAFSWDRVTRRIRATLGL